MLTGKIYSVTHEFLYVATLVNDSVIKSKRYRFGKLSVFSRKRLQKVMPQLRVYSDPVFVPAKCKD